MEFNKRAERGGEPAFGRRSTLYSNFRGDMDHQPSPNLVALEPGPFYRAQIGGGDFGTFPGLHGVGAAAVPVFGGYPGSHIGPAVIFGYGAGCDILNAPPNAASPEFEPTADMGIGLGC